MSDDQPASGDTHTVTIEFPPQTWDAQKWKKFKDEVKSLAKSYGGKVTAMMFESD
ncbi:MAG TPA: hypothetical protein VLG10_12720 [Methylomirabilota bacterium]|nr:hypothetical protein [Methylomirabilota bacterium]